jgi:hypothetical protein
MKLEKIRTKKYYCYSNIPVNIRDFFSYEIGSYKEKGDSQSAERRDEREFSVFDCF